MTTPVHWLAELAQAKAIAVIRHDHPDMAIAMAHSAAQGGMTFIEITWNTAQAASVISQLRRDLPHCGIGTGTILTPQDLQRAIAAGAQFFFTPHVAPALITQAKTAKVPLVAGCFSPTEIVTAWQLGATAVKIFPAQSLGGPAYIRNLQGPLGNIPMVPTGGVSLANCQDFLDSGAIAVGIASDLFPRELVAAQNWHRITQRIREFQTRLRP